MLYPSNILSGLTLNPKPLLSAPRKALRGGEEDIVE